LLQTRILDVFLQQKSNENFGFGFRISSKNFILLTVKTFQTAYFIIFLFFILANMGFPGTSSLVSEFLVLIGAFKSNVFVTVLATTGVIWGAGYSIWLYNRVAFGNIRTTHIEAFQDLDRKEFMVFVPCILLVFLMGIYPEIFLDVIHK
jgi:NADH-quinone oxidoreductase subunit M